MSISPAEKRRLFDCEDCHIDTSEGVENYYMVKHLIWNEFGVGKGMLCVDCLEKRLGRKLEASDILQAPINFMNPRMLRILGFPL